MDMNATKDQSLSHALESHPLRGLASIPVSPAAPRQMGSLDWRQALGIGLIALGTISVVVAWWGVSGTLDPGKQMPYISSGGFGGAILIAIGVTLLSSFEHARDRAALEVVLDRLDAIDERLSTMESARISQEETIDLSEDAPKRNVRASRGSSTRTAATRSKAATSGSRAADRTRSVS